MLPDSPEEPLQDDLLLVHHPALDMATSLQTNDGLTSAF